MNRNNKRKQGDYGDGNDGSGRPSPHRPDELRSARRNDYNGRMQNSSPRSQNFQGQNGSRGGRRPPRGGRNGSIRGGRPPSSDGPDVAHESTEAGPRSENHPQKLGDAPAEPEPSPTPIAMSASARTPAEIKPSSTPTKEVPHPLKAFTPPPTITPRSPPPFHYDILTEDDLQAWITNVSSSVPDSASKALAGKDFAAISSLFLEIIRSGLDQRMDAEKAGEAIQSIIHAAPTDSRNDASSIFLDTISMLPEADASSGRLRNMMFSTGIDAEVMRHQLEEPLLQSLGLTRISFGKMFVRKQTNILYRQANYNLLREETEGYSKLMTELFTVSQQERMPERVVETTHENVKALVGAFDMDAGRVLDIILDLFATVLIKNGRFFIKFLRHSSYWPQESNLAGIQSEDIQPFGSLPLWAQPGQTSFSTSDKEREHVANLRKQRDVEFWNEARTTGLEAFFGLGQRKILDKAQISEQIREPEKALKDLSDIAAVRALETKRWIEQTGTLPPQGNAVAAQLLGFKLRFYASSTRDKEDSLPVNVIYLAALLIKIGFISLRDLYPHLYPPDEEMEGVREKQMKKKEERDRLNRPGNSATNALARAGALSDDAPTYSTTSRLRAPEARSGTPSKNSASEAGSKTPLKQDEEDQVDPLPEPVDQKIALLKNLLLIGAIPEALYILGKFPWLLDALSELPSYIHRLLHRSLSVLEKQVYPQQAEIYLKEPAQVPAHNQSGVPKGDVRMVAPSPHRKKKWAQLENAEYAFYWEEWADNVPVCQTVDDVFTLCSTLLNLSGIRIGQDPGLVTTLARIGKYSLSTDTSTGNFARWQELLKRLLCPALSLTKSNPGVVNDVFDMLKTFPTQIRFNIYAEWFTGQTSRLPEIASAFDHTRAETKDIMKRINKTNTKEMARTLAKTSCASPGIVFEVCLNQIESYDNLIDVVVECGRYFTYMAYDVLTWSIMSCLGRQGRSRISHTGFTASKWLQAQSTFTGRIYKRFNVMSPLPMLQYVFDQLRQNNSTDLRILRDLISSMTGVVANTNFTDAQVMKMSGGRLLRSLTLQSIGDKRHEIKTTARRFVKTLVDNNLAGPMLVSIAQHRQTCVFNHEQDENKILSETFDEITVVLTQYLDMLNHYHSAKDFDKFIPDVVTLITEYGIEPSLAFTIHRTSIARHIAEYDAEHGTGKQHARLSDVEHSVPIVDVEMKDVAQESAISKAPELLKVHSKDKTTNDADVVANASEDDAQPAEDKSSPGSATTNSETKTLHPVLEDIAARLQPALGPEIDSTLSIPFFVAFWQLDLSQFVSPIVSYQSEQSLQTTKLNNINADKSDVTPAGIKRKDQEKRDILKTMDDLLVEMKALNKVHKASRARLTEEKHHWFNHKQVNASQLSVGLLQECFLPRLLVSPLDSQFTQKIIFFMHGVGTPGFRTLDLLGKIFARNTLTNLVFQSTSREADNLGRFLCEILKVMSEWHADRTTYEKMAHGQKKELPGFSVKTNAQGLPEAFLDFEDFRRILFTWHRNIFESIQTCFVSYEFMHVRNAITVLSRISKLFPQIKWMGLKLNEAIDALAAREKPDPDDPSLTPLARSDLHNAARSVKAGVIKREKDWVMPQAFSIAKPLRKPQNVDTGTQHVAKDSSSGDKDAPDNNAAANNSEANPSQNNIEPPLSATARSEVEEGEFRDVPMTDAPSKPVEVIADPAHDSSVVNAPLPDAASIKSTLPLADAEVEKPAPTKPISKDEIPKPTLAPAQSSQSPAETTQRPREPSDKRSQVSSSPAVTEPLSHNSTPYPRVEQSMNQRVAASLPPSRNQALDHAPNGPRNARQRSSNYGSEVPRLRDNMGPPPMPRTAMDRTTERSFPEPPRPARHQDMTYGRLNAEPDPFQGASSHSFARNGRPSQGPYQERQQSGTSAVLPPVSIDRANQYVSGQQDRHTRNNEQRGARPSSTPNTPGAASPTASEGVHPTRLRQIEEPQRVPPIQTSQSPAVQYRPSPSVLSSPSASAPPSGPRNVQTQPTDYSSNGASLPSPGNRGPPTGPAIAPNNPGIGRGDGRRQFSGLQEHLRQGGQPSLHNTSNGPQRPAVSPAAGPGGPVNSFGDRSTSQLNFRGAPSQPQDTRRTDSSRFGPMPNKPPAAQPHRSERIDTASVNPARAARIERTNTDLGSGRLSPRAEQQQHLSHQQHRSNMQRPSSPVRSAAPADTGTIIRGRASATMDVRPGPHAAAAVPANGSFPPPRPVGLNGFSEYNRRDDPNMTPVIARPPRDDQANNRMCIDGGLRRDVHPHERDMQGPERPLHHADSGRPPRGSREESRDRRVESERDRIMRETDKDLGSRPQRPGNNDIMQRDESVNNQRGSRDLMAGPPADYHERDRMGGGRARDERPGHNREDLMAQQPDRVMAPRRPGMPSAEYGAKGPFKDHRGEGRSEGRSDNRGNNRRGDYTRDRTSGGGNERAKREWNGGDGDVASRDNKRPRRNMS